MTFNQGLPIDEYPKVYRDAAFIFAAFVVLQQTIEDLRETLDKQSVEVKEAFMDMYKNEPAINGLVMSVELDLNF